jgi:hypothetical protein
VITAQSIIKVEICGMFLCEVLDDTEKPKAGVKSVALEHVCSVHPTVICSAKKIQDTRLMPQKILMRTEIRDLKCSHLLILSCYICES